MPEAPFEIKPFLAKGVISSYDTETGQFVTDIPVYYGNSGCPVIFVNNDNEVHLIGVVQKLIPFKLDWKTSMRQVLFVWIGITLVIQFVWE